MPPILASGRIPATAAPATPGLILLGTGQQAPLVLDTQGPALALPTVLHGDQSPITSLTIGVVRDVPDVTGKSADEAERILVAKGFNPVRQTYQTANGDVGNVGAQEPDQSKPVAVGSVVYLSVIERPPADAIDIQQQLSDMLEILNRLDDDLPDSIRLRTEQIRSDLDAASRSIKAAIAESQRAVIAAIPPGTTGQSKRGSSTSGETE